ncbi:lipase family protein [Stutzerimonas stutzeri]|uniref:lipase family protein n=1 Tax=Stutzerimonas stutzeri TaxID=316 RepID=UPI001F2E6650|nr:lipase family protein [Stutzerimonas stutzeri]MCQ4331763.1 lipase family protein [Stutzerimonas stutzeri]
MNDSYSPTALQCPIRFDWISFRLVDEHGNGRPYAGLKFLLTDSQGQTSSDVLDSDGYARVESLYGGPIVLSLPDQYSGNDPWYVGISRREKFTIPLTELQVAAEQSPAGPRRADEQTYLAEERAAQLQARLIRTEVSYFTEVNGHLPEPDESWATPPPKLKLNAGLAKEQTGIALGCSQSYVIEIKALRAFSPLLSREPDFCALNAYHLALMSTFVYAPFSTDKKPYTSSPPPYDSIGSIGHVLQNQLARRVKPTQFDGAGPYHMICEEVPYSKRLEIMPYDPLRYEKESQEGWRNPEDVHFLYDTESGTNTQAFITHNDKVVLISVRGTQEILADASRDADARQVRFKEGQGQAHRGFYGAFQAAKPFVERYLNAFYTGKQTLIVCGHSLGGAIALLLADWLRREWSDNTQLYTYGAPRAGDAAFVKAAQPLTHHRIVNHNDPVPAVPLPWMDAEWRLALPGTALLFSSPVTGIALLLAGLVNLQGDAYEHHGEQWHFMPRKPGGGSEAAVLWQPGCALIDEQICARYIGEIGLDGDMPNRLAVAGTHHASDSGYARAALTNLLRWNASVEERNGKLFSEAEMRDIYAQLLSTAQLLDSWQARSFNEFRWEIRRRGEMRFYGKSDLELRAIYADAVRQAERIRSEQSPALTRAQQRLLAQAERQVTPRSVFGEHVERADLVDLVAQWREIKDNQIAERLAAAQKASVQAFA